MYRITPMRRIFLVILFFVMTICTYSQNNNRFPLWTFHEKNVNIHGISIGLLSTAASERSTNTNGIRLELIGLGLLAPMIPDDPTFEEQHWERINGLNISVLGTVGNCSINGLSIGAAGQISARINGITLSMMINLIHKQNGLMIAGHNISNTMNGLQLGLANSCVKTNGVQIAFPLNESEKMRGVQIGVVNKSKKTKGIQIGIWNVNEKRRLPLINWNFKSTKKKETKEVEQKNEE